jgi:phage repressor protein C with HTH and peptisase S24 domain
MWFIRRVDGDSMSPTLKNNQLIICSHDRDIKSGNVVVAFVKNREVVKRVAKMESGHVFLESDNKAHRHGSRYYAKIIDTKIEGKVIWPRNL